MHRLFAPEPLKRQRNCRLATFAEPLSGAALKGTIVAANAAAWPQHLCCKNRSDFEIGQRLDTNYELFQWLGRSTFVAGKLPHAAVMLQQRPQHEFRGGK
jgi:hypothetical protein